MTGAFALLGRRGLFAGALASHAAVATAFDDAPDADLIRLCEALIQQERRINSLHASVHTIEDERRTEPDFALLFEEKSKIIDALSDLPAPRSIGGARAMARAAVATADRSADGEIISREEAEWLALSVAEFLAGIDAN